MAGIWDFWLCNKLLATKWKCQVVGVNVVLSLPRYIYIYIYNQGDPVTAAGKVASPTAGVKE